MAELTPKHQRFVDEYLVDLNASAAYRRAGYASKNADVDGPKLLGNPGIAAAVEEQLAARAARVEVTQDDVVRQLMAIAFGDLRDVVEWDGEGVRLRPSAELTPAQAATLREIEFEVNELELESGEVRRQISGKVKQTDRMRALELLGKHLGMFKETLKLDLGLSEMFERVFREARGS